jgi:citrate lyase beta subunit
MPLDSARVFLFTPANRPDRFPKAAATGADALILDLEDAVAGAGKDEARANLLAHFGGDWRAMLAPGQRCGLRVNNVHTQAGLRDLAALEDAALRPDFVLVPKVESAVEARLYARHLPGVPLLAAIESARGVEAAIAIATADAAVQGLVFGGADLAVDLRATLAWEPLFAARARIVQAAAIAAIAAIDVPHFALDDADALRAEAARAKAMGFTGKLAIHPKQIAPIVGVFTPSDAEVAQAREIVAALEAAHGNVVEHKGRMVEGPVVKAALRVLARAALGAGAASQAR